MFTYSTVLHTTHLFSFFWRISNTIYCPKRVVWPPLGCTRTAILFKRPESPARVYSKLFKSVLHGSLQLLSHKPLEVIRSLVYCSTKFRKDGTQQNSDAFFHLLKRTFRTIHEEQDPIEFVISTLPPEVSSFSALPKSKTQFFESFRLK